jgi:hypothetical protein
MYLLYFIHRQETFPQLRPHFPRVVPAEPNQPPTVVCIRLSPSKPNSSFHLQLYTCLILLPFISRISTYSILFLKGSFHLYSKIIIVVVLLDRPNKDKTAPNSLEIGSQQCKTKSIYQLTEDVPSNTHTSTPFFQKTVFFSKIFFGKPPSKFWRVCLNSEYM